jgi:hypothetical protein
MTVDRVPLRDAVGLVLALRRGDLGGYTELAKHYELNTEQRALLSMAVQFVVLAPGELDFEEFALYLGREP